MVVAETEDRTHHLAHEKPDILSQDAEMDESLASLTTEEIFTCNQCMDSFEDRDTLFKHVKQSHQQHVHSRRRFKCDQCQRTFKSMSGLRNHARTHSVFFGANAEVPSHLNSGPAHPVFSSKSNVSMHSSNDDVSCTMNSTFTVEKECDSMDVGKFNDAVSKETNISVENDDVSGSRDKCDRVNLGMRRRSGIPLPVRRSLLTHNDSKEDSQNENNKVVEEASIHKEKADSSDKTRESTTTSRKVRRESRRLTRVINTEHIQAAKQTVQRNSIFKSRTPKSRSRTPVQKSKNFAETKVTLKSPFGTKYTTKVESPVTPSNRNRSKSKSRTPQNGCRTPKGGNCTPLKGKSTQINGKRTPGSSKKHTPVSKGYNCQKCGKSFVDKSKLDVHFTVHARETPEKCGIPKHALKKTPSLQMESPLVTEPIDGNKSSFSCTQCGRVYEKKKYLDAHMKTHDVSTPFSCAYCDKKFRFLSSLKAHLFVHQGESRDQNCTINVQHKSAPTTNTELKRVTIDSSLKFNIFSTIQSAGNSEELCPINDDLPFTCKMCGFQTRAPAELLIHMKTHSKSGPFTCTHCCKSYTLQKNLKMHEKVHTINRLKKMLIENTIIKATNQSAVHTR